MIRTLHQVFSYHPFSSPTQILIVPQLPELHLRLRHSLPVCITGYPNLRTVLFQNNHPSNLVAENILLVSAAGLLCSTDIFHTRPHIQSVLQIPVQKFLDYNSCRVCWRFLLALRNSRCQFPLCAPNNLVSLLL